jgi:hypothetical protein
MRRTAAARGNELGLQIFTPPQLAARLAGGLVRHASRASVEVGIRTALTQPDRFLEIAPICEVPACHAR